MCLLFLCRAVAELSAGCAHTSTRLLFQYSALSTCTLQHKHKLQIRNTGPRAQQNSHKALAILGFIPGKYIFDVWDIPLVFIKKVKLSS
jgi:hypothetical protein